MTDDEIKKYYSSLLIKQFANQPNAIAQIQALAGAVVIGQVFTAVQNSYNLSDAVGVQLQVLGKYLGVSNKGFTFSGPITLDDDDYRTALILASIKNTSDATLFELQKSIETFFPGVMRLYDYLNMSMSYFIDPGLFSTDLAEFCLNAGIFPKPAGVRLGATVLAPINTNYYGWVSYLNPVPFTQSPFGTYADYELTHPWLSYYDAIGAISSSALLTEDGDVLDTEDGIGIALE